MQQGGLWRRGRSRRVVLTVHSYVRRLERYMSMSSDRRNLGQHDVEVRCVGVSGGALRPDHSTRRPYRCMWRYVSHVSHHRPDVIYVHLSENNLGRISRRRISAELLRFVDALSVLCTTRTVIIGQLIPFPDSPFRDDAIDMNNHLLQEVPSPHIFWIHRSGFREASRQLFLAGDVHLNQTGMLRYWRSI